MKTKDKSVNLSIYKTKDYDKFKIHNYNRNRNEGHVNRIKKKMEKHGFIPSLHITVSKNFEVLDGQHRLWAAQKAGEPVFYHLTDRTYSVEEVIDINTTGKSWSINDYIDLYETVEKEGEKSGNAYTEFKEYKENWNLNSSALYTALPRNPDDKFSSNVKASDVKDGNLDDYWPNDKSDLERVLEVWKFVDKKTYSSKTRSLMRGLRAFLFSEDVRNKTVEDIIDRFKKASDSPNDPLEKIVSSANDVISMFVEAYNHGLQRKSSKHIDSRPTV